MDDFKKIYRGILVICLIAAIVMLVVLILEIVRRFREKRILSEKRKEKDFISLLLKNNFPFAHIFSARVLKMKEADHPLVPIDLIVVNRGGIALVTVLRKTGEIDNPFRGDWALSKPEGLVPFPNPIEKMIPTVRAFEQLLSDSGISDVPVTHLVVLTGRKVKFKNELDRVLCAEDVSDYLRDMNGEKVVTRNEVRDCVGLIEEYTKPYVPKKRTK